MQIQGRFDRSDSVTMFINKKHDERNKNILKWLKTYYFILTYYFVWSKLNHFKLVRTKIFLICPS